MMRRAGDRHWPAVAWLTAALLLALACARVDAAESPPPKPSSEVCSSMDIRNSPENMNKLRGCRVIEGQLSIVLMEKVTPDTFQNYSFPELREVTDYIKIYRLKGVRNFGDLFPNLTVVRGMRLYKDYAIVIYDNEHMESLGLRSLTRVQRGGVRIQHNDRLCYTDTINWSKIVAKENQDNVYIRSNYDPRLCGLCPDAQERTAGPSSNVTCPTDPSGLLLCWDEKHCQKICPTKCGESGCLADKTCCHHTCLGGCSGPTAADCFACKNYSFEYGSKRTCVTNCPSKTYKLKARCVTEDECRSMPPSSVDVDAPPSTNLKTYKIYNNESCVLVCPSGYMEGGDEKNASCIPCPGSGCRHNCSGAKIDSIAAAEQFRGCTHVRGKLEIALRASGSNAMSILESSLGEIREVEGCLQVTRSYMLVSLMFLKNLRHIRGTGLYECKGQVLNIFNNPNLELLWDFDTYGSINITGGSLYVHLNPKLCYDRILPLQNMTSNPRSQFTEIEVSEDNNGDQASCHQEQLHLKVHENGIRVILTWDAYCVDDARKLLGYSVYYIAAEKNVTLYGQRDACSDTWNVIDRTKDEVRSANVTEDPKDLLIKDPCPMQPSFAMLPDLKPFTRYAAYVKAYTTQQDRRGAQSSIIYFKTLPGRPSPPVNLIVEHEDAHSVSIKWSPPVLPNGELHVYNVEIQANSYNGPKILGRSNVAKGSTSNYCNNPNALANNIRAGYELSPRTRPEKQTGEVTKNSTCACEKDDKPGVRFSRLAEEERIENIQFENDLQNTVYIKTNKKAKTPRSRRRRSVDNTLQSMLVILSDNNSPRFGSKYTNSTEGEGYVKSQFYELNNRTTSLKVMHMRHCTWYTVNVWACRKRDPNENDAHFEDSWCSERAYNTFRTLALVDADIVTSLRAEILPSNNTELNVTWVPPINPNGFLAAYSIQYSKVEENTQGSVPSQICLPADEFDKQGRGYTLRYTNFVSGNYSIKVTPITVNGAGNVSEIFVFIPESPSRQNHEWIWGLVGACFVVFLFVAGGIWYARRGLLPTAEANKLFASVNPEYVSTVYVPDEWEVPRGNIELVRELGQGSFGMVYEGIGKGIEKGKPETRCAVKTVNEHATDRERIEFLNEASVMKAFDTFHVVRLLGVVSRGQPTLVVMELMELGDLKTYLRSHRPDAENSIPKKDGGNPPTLQNILQMAIEIADGMAYLSAKKFVHRDLAARNCMVAGDLTVKVGDFGMTRDIYETDYYRKGTKGLLPVRWMSPESLKDGVFSSNSDVWSYGVVLWEMVTLAMLPYQGLSNEQVVRYVVEGGVMERPEHCPDRLYELMRACWAHRPAARPAFLQLVADLAPSAMPYFRLRSFFHSPQGQEIYALQRSAADEEAEVAEVNVGAVATGSGSNLFGVSGRLASWVLSSLRSRTPDDAAAEPLQPLRAKPGPNGALRELEPGC